MKFRKLIRPLLVSIAIGSLLFIAILFWPPWWGKVPFVIHYHYGVPHLYFGATADGRMLPDDFTGTYNQYYRNGVLGQSEEFVNGEIHGIRRDYNEDGSLKREGVYKEGLPWSGWCSWWDGKPWAWAEYREGVVWTGVSHEWNEELEVSLARYFFEGKEYSEDEYKSVLKAVKDRGGSDQNRTEQNAAGQPATRAESK
jgi:antitoxin component YwqK of YwqJK toxin-antitoxin module